LHHPLWNWRRKPVYQEIMNYSYEDYFDRFAIPYYAAKGIVAPVADAMEQAGDLRSYAASLHANPDVRVIVNQNDFLLEDEDRAWLNATFATNRLTVFQEGGHLGNLANPTVQKAILAALTPMRPPQVKAK